MKRDKFYGCWKDENGNLYRQIGAAREIRTDVITKRSLLWEFADKYSETEGTLTYINVYGRKITPDNIRFFRGGTVKITDTATGKKEVTLNGQEAEYSCRLFFSLDESGEKMKVFEFLGRRG